MGAIPAEVQGFVDRATVLGGAAFVQVENAHLGTDELSTVFSRKGPRLSAAEASALDKDIRDRLRPCADELRTAAGVGAISTAISVTSLTATMIWKRDEVDPRLFDLAMAPWRSEGVSLD